METNSKTIIINMAWRFLESSSHEIIQFIISIILARILAPSAYGTIAIVQVIISFLGILVNSGLGIALIQKKDADSLDYSSVFYFNIVICFLLYIGLFIVAPYISRYYNINELISIIRVMGLLLIIYGIRNVQQAFVSRNFLFKVFFKATLFGTIISAILGLILAYNGYGVWALVWQSLSSASINLFVIWFTIKWRPDFMFSFKRLQKLFTFGWKIFVSSIFDSIFRNIRALIIGKLYSVSDLAYYQRGHQIPTIITNNINNAIDSVLFPTLSRVQDDRNKTKEITRHAIMISSFFIMPMMTGLAVCSYQLVNLLLTSKWISSVFYIRIFCFTFAFYPVHTANLNAIKSIGRSDLYLILEIVKKSVGLILLLSTVWINIKAMAYSLLLNSILNQIINSWPNKKLLGYSYLEQLYDMFPQIITSCIMGIIVYSINFFKLNDILTICIQIPLGIISYILFMKIFKFQVELYIEALIMNFFKTKQNV